MNPIQRNKPIFFGDDGRVLANGFIYIGQPNQDPIQYPLDVTFRDNQGNEFTATQPLRTNENGQISYNGSAIVALVDGDYSMIIRRSTNVNIDDFYTPLIENESSSQIQGGNIQYGLTLADVKATSVAAGDVIDSIGRLTVDDGLGSRWLVQAQNGETSDDVNYITFANGLQGARVYELSGDINVSFSVEYTPPSTYAIANVETTPGVDADVSITLVSGTEYNIDVTHTSGVTFSKFITSSKPMYDSGSSQPFFIISASENTGLTTSTFIRHRIDMLRVIDGGSPAPLKSQESFDVLMIGAI